jgi:hypothetical protein
MSRVLGSWREPQLEIVPDAEGSYKLVTEQRVLPRGVAARHGLLLRPIHPPLPHHFLVSPEAAELEHLQFCWELVVENETLPLRRELTEALRREAELTEEVGRLGAERGGHVIYASVASEDAIVIDDATAKESNRKNAELEEEVRIVKN